MSKNRPSFGIRLFRLPWWVSVVCAIACYCSFKYLIPQLQPTIPALAGMVRAAPSFAPLVTIPLLLLAAKQLYDIDQPKDEDPNGGDRDNRVE